MSKRDFFEEEKMNKMITIFGVVLVVSIIAFIVIFTIYNKKLKEGADISVLDLGAINSMVPNDNTVSASTTQDKGKEDNTIKNVTNNLTNNTASNTEEKTNTTTEKKEKTSNTSKNTVNNTTSNTVNSVLENDTSNTTENSVENSVNNTNTSVENTSESLELSFMAPVAGEILKDFASDTLIYSNTLEEWTIHLGIDIKAERTSVVVASEAGKVESIKSDPRYGLTITIDHGNGCKTIYSNLLTTEFVQTGETVEKGQTIATVGDTASFEVLDEPHLHFEMYINGEAVNPTLYFK